MTSLPDEPPLLVSEDDRDTAVRRLQEAYVEGHISHEEMDERLHAVLTAKTHSELVSALASLPAGNAGTTSMIAAVSGRILCCSKSHRRRSSDIAVLADHAAEDPGPQHSAGVEVVHCGVGPFLGIRR
ncbi:DUF1707 SHOCT-like domain-containing protein [Streptomyces hirsutus]|uniref:DUF1707 SHOCT-like domain-containing protein n=1 Tax=Streptomyces hirsutus TaxID=35620 RepID=UPI0033AEF55A